MEPSNSLEQALERFELPLPPDQIEQIDAYCRLLWDHNEQINLTRHTTFDKFVARDVMDSWQLARCLKDDEDVLDVGTGGGVPGILLAILRPEVRVTLCDSVSKKAAVVNSMVAQLGLPVPVHDGRAEKLLDDFRYDSLVARAVGPLWKMLHWFQDGWASIGQLLAVKGPRWVEERKVARHRGLLTGLELRRLTSYRMPGTESESVILRIARPRPST